MKPQRPTSRDFNERSFLGLKGSNGEMEDTSVFFSKLGPEVLFLGFCIINVLI